MGVRRLVLTQLEVNPREQQLAHGGLRRDPRLREDGEGGVRVAAGLEVPALLMEHESAIGVDEGRPRVVVLSGEHLACLLEEIEGTERLSLSARSDGQNGERLRCLVPQLLLLEACERGCRELYTVVHEIELEKELRLVEVAEGTVVVVLHLDRSLPGDSIELDGARVFAA